MDTSRSLFIIFFFIFIYFLRYGLYYANYTGQIEFTNLEELTKYYVFYTTADEDPSSFFREG